MKATFIIIQIFLTHQVFAMNTTKHHFIQTSIGKIAVYEKSASNQHRMPVIFLHGLYFDHEMWKDQVSKIDDRRVISIDMPMHGKSTDIIPNWTLNDCANMLIELLDSLKIDKTYGVGHSWGSMTLLRAMTVQPSRFEHVGLFNMPYQVYTSKEARKIRMQHIALVFKRMYIKQAAKTLFSASSMEKNPELVYFLSKSMSKLSRRTIKFLDQTVRIESSDQTETIAELKISHTVIMGSEDYIVPLNDNPNAILINAGHVIPLEAPQRTAQIIQSFFDD